MDTILIGRPSVVASNWKSTAAQTRLGASALGGFAVLVPRRLRRRRWGHAKAFLAPEPLDPLVVDGPAVDAGVVIGGAEPAPRVILRVLAQPLPQSGIRVGHRGTCRFSSLRCSVLPGDPAGEPLTDLHRGDEVLNGRLPAFRA
jgi:hypothetical protein